MALRTIVTLPDPILRRKARPVKKFDKDLQTLIDDMVDTMRDAPGVGLAAPQIGISERLIVIEYAEPPENEDDEEVKPKLYVVVNPEIVKTSAETEVGVEGCLSIPGLVGEVERFSKVQVKGLNRRGQPTKVNAEGWLARIFQHEIDHVNGIVYPDRAVRVWKPQADEDEEMV
ncbi:MAG TPA: peptide deformylase [Anaerolineales bacterium]|jgi:peptide deformylase|nr:peptide deformylase [Anaerolineales bacterium]